MDETIIPNIKAVFDNGDSINVSSVMEAKVRARLLNSKSFNLTYKDAAGKEVLKKFAKKRFEYVEYF